MALRPDSILAKFTLPSVVRKEPLKVEDPPGIAKQQA